MDKPAIEVKDISKIFELPHERSGSIKSAMINVFRRKRGYEIQQALEDINFEVKQGEFFGIVGRNGSGKSTLLKIIAGIYTPTTGNIKVNGSLTPFIELGVGFNRELTGRENVYLNGALLGIPRKQMRQLYGKIVEFAELERFMDQKLKNYSSGMQVRLAFSIAIQAPGDILLLDEVLAVGDSSFQRKCLEVFRAMKKTDKTIVLVTHAMGTVQEFCDRALMIEDSKVIAIGDPMKISAQYELANSSVGKDGERRLRPKDPAVKVKAVKIHGAKSTEPQTDFSLSQDIVVDVDIEVRRQKPFQVSIALYNTDGEYVSGLTSKRDIKSLDLPKGQHTLTCHIKAGQLAIGAYRPRVSLATDEEDPELIDVASNDYGTPIDNIVITELSLFVKGQFYMSAEWKIGDKAKKK